MYKVKAAGGTTQTQVGDTLQLTLQPDAITAIDKDCPPARPVIDKLGHEQFASLCPVDYTVTLHIPPASVTGLAAGASAHFVSITWATSVRGQQLIFEAKKKDYSSILSLLEGVTGRRVVDADAHSTDRPLVVLHVPYGLLGKYLPDMASDFRKVCPTVQIAGKNQKADFTVVLQGAESDPLATLDPLDGRGRPTMGFPPFEPAVVAVYNQDGEYLGFRYGVSVKDTAKGACTVITNEWAVHRQKATR